MSPLVREAIAAVMPVERLRWVAFSHVEADECGGLNELLAVAPQAQPLCGQVAAMVSVNDLAEGPPLALGDGEVPGLGRARVRWLDAPHLPHAWDCGYLFEQETRTLLCGDLFCQPGAETCPSTLACMHGSAWAGDGRGLLLELADTLVRAGVAAA
jgi:flavorubredoxin